MIEPQHLSDEVKHFILAHTHADVPSLVLKYPLVDGLPISLIVDQIVGRRKARAKLPTYAAHDLVLYPPAINLEQTSSEATGRFKASLLASLSNADELVDLTGGFGIDSFAFSKHFKVVVHVEQDGGLQRLAQFNHALLGSQNISYVNETSEAYIERMKNVSAVYIDPSRRNASRKVYSFHDCSPDITHLQDEILNHTGVLMVKASPMHDIQLALAEIRHVEHVVVLAVDNEVRELLFVAVRGFNRQPVISAVNVSHSGTVSFGFTADDERTATTSFGDVMTYLYEPNAALLKAGAFKLVAQRYHLHKLHINTHLYTSDELIGGFPGRTFRVLSAVKADYKNVINHFPERKANIIVRNYPSSPDVLKKKLKLTDGGDRYLLAFTSPAGPMMVAATRIT